MTLIRQRISLTCAIRARIKNIKVEYISFKNISMFAKKKKNISMLSSLKLVKMRLLKKN